MSTAVQPLATIGHVTPRVDAIERVTGQAKYTNAAVANAIFNATGLRMTSLPMTRDKLLGALR